MIEDLKPYPQYKDSGLPWLGQVPAHWEIRPASGAFSPIRERNTGMNEKTILSLSYGRIVVKPTEKLHGLVPESFETYQIVNPGVTVIRTTDLQNDKTSLRTGIVRDRGIITSAYLALSTSAGLLPEFGYQFLNAWDVTKAIYGYGSGLRQNLDFSDFRRMPVAVPPIAEQAFIARFLAWATNRLDRAIGAKRRIIALLQEQKQAIIHRAVTRGLDPSVPLKDSGIPWLGEIPEHWEVRRAKYLFREIDDRSARGGEELLSVSHMTGVTPRSQKNITMFKAASYAGHKLCQPGDLVINTMWAWMGALGTSSYPGIISPAYAVYRPRQMTDIIDTYIDFLLRSTPYIANIICQSTGLHTSRLRLYPEAFFRLPIILPPREEQLLIVDKLKGDTADLNTAISRLESEITLLREYRTRLIADVVTGKLDVREVAKGLPEEELQDQLDASAGYDADEAEDDAESDLIDTAED